MRHLPIFDAEGDIPPPSNPGKQIYFGIIEN